MDRKQHQKNASRCKICIRFKSQYLCIGTQLQPPVHILSMAALAETYG
jgi:hypothetical protein